jgi:hypothetical protein
MFFRKFRPSDIPNLEFWVDAMDYSSLSIVSTKVSAWIDKSGNNRWAGQSVDAARGTFSSTGLNGLPTITFVPSQYMYLNNNPFRYERTQAFSVFVVSDLSSGSATQTMMGNFYATESYRGWEFRGFPTGSTGAVHPNTTVTGAAFYNSNVANGMNIYTTLYTTGVRVRSFVYDGSSTVSGANFAINNNTTTTYNNLTNPFNATMVPSSGVTYIGGRSSDNACCGNLSEILLISRAVSAIERYRINAYLAAKWKLSF